MKDTAGLDHDPIHAIVGAALGDVLYAAELPPPISVNNLFHNTPKAPGTERKQKGRWKAKSYRDWIANAGWVLNAQGKRPRLSGPVALIFALGQQCGIGNIDTDNCAKAYIDLLVKHRILPEDNRRVVRHLSITWVESERCSVHVYRWSEP